MKIYVWTHQAHSEIEKNSLIIQKMKHKKVEMEWIDKPQPSAHNNMSRQLLKKDKEANNHQVKVRQT